MASESGKITSPSPESAGPLNEEGLRQRVLQSIADYQESKARTTEAQSPVAPASMDVAEVTRAFEAAALASPSGTRLVVATADCLEGKTAPAVVRLPKSVGPWNAVGVVQHATDVDFAICLPFYDPPVPYPAREQTLAQNHLRVKIYYNPASDACVLLNSAGLRFSLTSPDGSLPDRIMRPGAAVVVAPGLWKISAGGRQAKEQHLVDFLLLRRSFTVSLLTPVQSENVSVTKRAVSPQSAPGQTTAAKRQRAEDAAVEISATPVEASSTALEASGSRSLEYTPKPTLSAGSPLLDLDGMGIAIVRSSQPVAAVIQTQGQGEPDSAVIGKAAEAAGMDGYRLSRVQHIANTASASVFAARHSLLPGDVVVKVSKYRGPTPADLIKSASSWLSEKRAVEKLDHRNIMSLRGSDSRVFALYLEHLPVSLSRDTKSPFTYSDAEIIIRGVAAGLQYLEAQDICHNDIKPGNISYSPVRGAVLIDFGLATSEKESHNAGGTPWYLPPEAMKARRGFPGDVWALGVTMLYILAKIPLPDQSANRWFIADIRANSRSREAMIKWLGLVRKARRSLDTEDATERAVFLALNEAPEARVDAADMVLLLKAEDEGRSNL